MYSNPTTNLSCRLDDIKKTFRETNSTYALSVEAEARLLENVIPIMTAGHDLLICSSDCLDIQELLEQKDLQMRLLEQEFYRQAQLDCVRLLRLLGILA